MSSSPSPTLSRPDRHAWDRRAKLGLFVVLFVTLASLPFLVHGWFEATDETNDASIYVASARALLAGEGYSYLGQPFTVRPPGMSLLLAGIFALRGADWFTVNLVVSLFGVACVALVYFHAQRRIGAVLAALAALSIWFSGPFQAQCNQAMSDVPGAALLLGCLAIERWAAAKRSWQRDVVLGVAIGLSTYMRSVVILVIPAIAAARVLAEWSSSRPDGARGWLRFALLRVAPFALAAVAVKMPWDVRCALHHPEPPVDQNFLFDYSTAMWHVDGGDPSSPRRELSSIAGNVPGRAERIAALIGGHLLPGTVGAPAVALGVVVLVLVAVVAWRRRDGAEFFALVLLGVLLVYFGFRDRLALPLWLIALPATVDGFLMLAGAKLAPTIARVIAGLFLVLLPYLGFRPRADWDRIEAQHAFYVRYAAEVAAAVPPEQRVASQIGWHLSVYLDRPVWSLFFGAKRAGGLQGAFEVLEKYDIDAIALSPRITADRDVQPGLTARSRVIRTSADALVLATRR